jgi:ABC-type transport system involved in cytochrome bd biosynthesis fused ATPase/permease subunit
MILLKILDFLVAICVASMIALTLGFVAHYVFGLSRLDIRASALTGAAIFALLVATEWFAKLRKSK